MGLEDLLQPGAAGPLLLIAAALGLGALHALEPGHAKTLMAAFIVAVRGTPWQAALLAASVAVSHTLIVWLLAWAGWQWGMALITDQLRPYLVVAAGAVVALVGLWSAARAWRMSPRHPAGPAPHHHPHSHAHHDGHLHSHDHLHDHDHADDADAHARLHARTLSRHLAAHGGAGDRASNRQVVLLGLSGGMIPCSAAVAVLLVCLQQKDALLGIGLVGAFTLGLAATLAAIGCAAAAASRTATRLVPRAGWMRYASCASGVVLAILGLVTVDGGLALIGV